MHCSLSPCFGVMCCWQLELTLQLSQYSARLLSLSLTPKLSGAVTADAGLLWVQGTVVGAAIKGTPCVTGYRLILLLLPLATFPSIKICNCCPTLLSNAHRTHLLLSLFYVSVLFNDTVNCRGYLVLGDRRMNSGVPRNFVSGGGVQQIQLRTEDRGNWDLRAVAL